VKTSSNKVKLPKVGSNVIVPVLLEAGPNKQVVHCAMALPLIASSDSDKQKEIMRVKFPKKMNSQFTLKQGAHSTKCWTK
jgi:hypothetical protein